MMSLLSKFFRVQFVLWVCFLVPSLVWADDQRLLGSWQGEMGEQVISLAIVSNSQLLFDGVPAYYQQFPGLIRVWGDSGPVDYRYLFDNEALFITFPEGYQLQFVKEGESAAGGWEERAVKDYQLKELLLSSAWCAYIVRERTEYQQKLRTTKREMRLEFYPNGSYRQSSRSRAYSTQYGGGAMGEYNRSQSGRWRVQEGMLFTSVDGAPVRAAPLDIISRPGEAPILNYFGTPFIPCN